SGPAQIIVSGSFRITAHAAGTGDMAWWLDGMAWQAKSTPVLDGDMLYVHSWMASPAELGLPSVVPPFAQVLKDKDADKDGRLSKAESPDPEMTKIWFLIDLDKDGSLDEREWKFHQARASARNGLFAIQLGGKGDLTGKAIRWRHEKSLPNIPSPLLYKDVLYVLREGGIVTTLNPTTGAVLKQGRLEGALDPYYASPVAADGKVYMVSMNGMLSVIKAGGQWELLAVSDLGEECWATPAIADGRIYVRTEGALYCFGTRS
ncbi:MAG: PQQ-binding-like beta-propeller repeat protein, partial [Bryobacteraceae bacterium]